MLADEGLEALGPLQLPLFLISHVVVVFHNLFNTLPIVLDHAAHVLSPFLNLVLHVLSLSFLLELFLMHLLTARSCILFGIADLLLGLPLKILRHPLHLLDHEVPMIPLLLLRSLSSGNPEVVCAGPTGANLVLELSQLPFKVLPLLIKVFNLTLKNNSGD